MAPQAGVERLSERPGALKGLRQPGLAAVCEKKLMVDWTMT